MREHLAELSPPTSAVSLRRLAASRVETSAASDRVYSPRSRRSAPPHRPRHDRQRPQAALKPAPAAVWLGDHAGNLDTPRGQVSYEEDGIARQGRPGPHFNGEKIRRGEDLPSVRSSAVGRFQSGKTSERSCPDPPLSTPVGWTRAAVMVAGLNVYGMMVSSLLST